MSEQGDGCYCDDGSCSVCRRERALTRIEVGGFSYPQTSQGGSSWAEREEWERGHAERERERQAAYNHWLQKERAEHTLEIPPACKPLPSWWKAPETQPGARITRQDVAAMLALSREFFGCHPEVSGKPDNLWLDGLSAYDVVSVVGAWSSRLGDVKMTLQFPEFFVTLTHYTGRRVGGMRFFKDIVRLTKRSYYGPDSKVWRVVETDGRHDDTEHGLSTKYCMSDDVGGGSGTSIIFPPYVQLKSEISASVKLPISNLEQRQKHRDSAAVVGGTMLRDSIVRRR